VKLIEQSQVSSVNTSTPAKHVEQPLLLFPVAHRASENVPATHKQRIPQQTDTANVDSKRLFPWARSVDSETSSEPGLYMSFTGIEHHPYADSFRLVLPYTLGWSYGARTSSLDPFRHRYAELYRLGYDSCGGGSGGRDAQLATSSDRWRGRLREAHAGRFTCGWGVDEQGVEAIEDDGEVKGIEIIKNADDGNYAIYCLPGPSVLNTQRCAEEAVRRAEL
jgi:hypothetical protein